MRPVASLISKRALSTSSTAHNQSNKTGTLVLCRHGQSTWNELNLFTGWADVPLTALGQNEASEAGKAMKKENILFDVAYTSVLKRAIKTLNIALEEMDMMYLPVHRTWRLNERHYGALQGLDKAATAAKFGEEKVMEWRRSYSIPPPPVELTSQHYPGNDVRYRNVDKTVLPRTESLKTTGERFLPEWESVISPRLKRGENVLIVAHGNSLRALVKHLDNISEKDIIKLNIPTGVPLLYQLDSQLKPIKQKGAVAPLSGRYLGDAQAIAAAAEAVAKQASAKKA